MENVFVKRKKRMAWNVAGITAVFAVLGLLVGYQMMVSEPGFVSSATAGLVQGKVTCTIAGTEQTVRNGQTIPLDAGNILVLRAKTDLVIFEIPGLSQDHMLRGPLKKDLFDVRSQLNEKILYLSRIRSDRLSRTAGWILAAFFVFLAAIIIAYRKKSELINGHLLAIISIIFSLMGWFAVSKLVRPAPMTDILIFAGMNAILVALLSLVITRQQVIPEVQELEDKVADLIFAGYGHLSNKDHAGALQSFREALALNPTLTKIWQMVKLLEMQDDDPSRFAELLRRRTYLMEKLRISSEQKEE